MVDQERALGKPTSRAALLNEITADPTWHPTFVFYMGYLRDKAEAISNTPFCGQVPVSRPRVQHRRVCLAQS